MPSLRSSGSVCWAASRASSRKSNERLVSRVENRPSSKSIWSGVLPRIAAATCLPRAMRSTAALEKTVAGVAHRAAGVRAAADLHDVGVAEDDLHGLDRHVQQVRDHLREARLVALAARLRADHHIDAALGPHVDAGLFVRRADRRLDVVGKAAPQELAAPGGVALALREALPVGDLHRPVHVLGVAAAVVQHADGVAVRHGLRRDRGSCAAARSGRSRVARRRCRSAARSRRSPRAGPSCGRPASAWCW